MNYLIESKSWSSSPVVVASLGYHITNIRGGIMYILRMSIIRRQKGRQ